MRGLGTYEEVFSEAFLVFGRTEGREETKAERLSLFPVRLLDARKDEVRRDGGGSVRGGVASSDVSEDETFGGRWSLGTEERV